jgi:hypothetical protein
MCPFHPATCPATTRIGGIPSIVKVALNVAQATSSRASIATVVTSFTASRRPDVVNRIGHRARTAAATRRTGGAASTREAGQLAIERTRPSSVCTGIAVMISTASRRRRAVSYHWYAVAETVGIRLDGANSPNGS